MPFWRRRRKEDPLVCREFVELVTGYLEDMRRLVGSLHETPEPPPDEATRDALLRAFRELRGEP